MSNFRQNLPFELAALSCAKDLIGLVEVGGDNRGPAVQMIQKAGNINPGDPWCAATVNYCAEYAQVLTNQWSPLEKVPLQGYVQSYYQYGLEHGWLIPFEKLFIGCLYVVWFPSLDRHGHIGFVSNVLHTKRKFESISGNSNDDGSREGYEVAQKWESFDPVRYQFMDWTIGLREFPHV